MHTVPKLDQQFNDFMGFREHLSDSIGLSFIQDNLYCFIHHGLGEQGTKE